MIRVGDFETTDEHRKIINEILDSGRLTEGPKVDELERKMENYLGVKHAIMVTNGTVALQLVSHAIDRQVNVCVPAMTFPATLNAFLLTGRPCMLCDIGEDLQIDIDTLTEEEKHMIDVMVVVHLMGYSADMDKIMEAAKTYNWFVIEDTAESFGATTSVSMGQNLGKVAHLGTIGDVGTYSFYTSHNLGSGELGMVVTNNDELADKMRSIKNHGRIGSSLQFNHKYMGSNYKTTEFAAGICLANFKEVDETLNKRRENARYLKENIDNIHLETFDVPDNSSLLGFPIKVSSNEKLQEVTAKLNEAGVETREIFPCLKNQEAYDWYETEEFPVAEDLEKRIFYLGCHQYLNKEDLDVMIEVLNAI